MIRFFHELRESRPLKTAILASLLWHLVWLFVIFIDVSSPAIRAKLEPKIYFVGPVLSDDSFNMILAERPEFSTTTYRSPLGQTVPSLEPQPQAMARPEPGDLVSVPLGQSTWGSLRGQMRGEKPYPEAVFRKKLQVEIVRKPFPIDSGPLNARELVSVPVFPALPDRGDAPSADPEFDLAVTAAGTVREARLTISSGDPETDRMLERYLKQWQFVPLEENRGEAVETGHVRIPTDSSRRQG